MLWYLLYPLRGTTQPPRLEANHPIRRAFYRHGKATAQYWLAAMLVSVAIGVALSYPTVFLSENPTAGFTSKPHQVWTTTKHVDEDDGVRADVEMRQVWVHGSYMAALEKNVLKSALTIQQTLVGGEKPTSIVPAFGDKLKTSSLSWGYHSPLMYWNDSAELIDDDEDVVRTINDQASAASSLNVVLRPASVFAGKIFQRRKLLAADALVLTLMNKVEDGVGSTWQHKMQSLEGRACENCTLYPPHGELSRNRVYEFGFTPLSVQENLALAMAYACMALYVTLSLRRIKAFHSRVGLVVTAITQITTSILASFTICGMLKINLANVPQNAYPFVVLVIGLENMFRLINAVLAYPPTMATDSRIANALGDVGPLSIATAGQNLIILWLLSRVVSVGVAAFCAFAAIATLFDSFFLLTFFVAVLNVDIRRLELQDSLARSHQVKRKRRRSPRKRSWIDAMVSGKVPFSTRMAGSVVTTTFILSLNYHFFEHQEQALSFRHLMGLFTTRQPPLGDLDNFGEPPMNISLTPGEWIRMQDFETAREVMRLVKPGAHSLIIRVFSPLIVVLSGADRTGVPTGLNAWTDVLRGLALHHFYPFAIVVVFVVTFVAVLMNFLLWNEAPEDSEESIEQAVTVRDVALPHKLDIIKLASCNQGHFVSVALDRTVAISVVDSSQGLYNTEMIPRELVSRLQWPIRQVTIDWSGNFVALHCGDDLVVVYHRPVLAFVGSPLQYPDDNPAVLFAFIRLPSTEGLETHLVALTSGGRLVSASVHANSTQTASLSQVPLLGAAVIEVASQSRRLFVVTDEARIVVFTYDGHDWTEHSSQQLAGATGARLTGNVKIQQFGELTLDLLAVSTAIGVFFLNVQTLAVVNRISAETTGLICSTLSLGTQARCPECGSVGVRSLGMVSEEYCTGSINITQLSASGESSEALCVQRATARCQSFEQALVATRALAGPNSWLPLQFQAGALGLRKLNNPALALNDAVGGSHTRRRRRGRLDTQADEGQDEWEAYKFCLESELETVETASTPGDNCEEPSLYVATVGPIVPLDALSVGVAFGNVVKIIRASRRGPTSKHADSSPVQRHASTSRKRQAARKAQ